MNLPLLGVDLAGPKEIGKIWGGGHVVRKADGNIYGTETRMYSILAIETIIVPAGTFEGCVKIYQLTGTYDPVSWYAEGIGLVKLIGVNGLFELQSY